MIKAVIFDLDQTLLDRTATFRLFTENQHQRFVSQLGGCDQSKYWDTMHRFDDNGYKDKQTMFTEVCEHLGLTINPNTLFEDFKTHYGNKPVLFRHAEETLENLKTQYKIAVITNGRVKAQATKIQVSGIFPYFDVITISEAVGVKKPDPRIFQHCIDGLELKANDCVYIGDHPINDIEAALNFGMKAIWVKNLHFHPPSMEFDGTIENLQ